MNREELSQLNGIKIEIEILNKQIEGLPTGMNIVTDSVVGSFVEFPYTQHNITIMGVDMQSYDRKARNLRRKLKVRMNELMDKAAEINDYISTVPDSEMRSILALRYINNLSWQQIAYHMGVEGDGSTERKKHDRFLKTFPKFPKRVCYTERVEM